MADHPDPLFSNELEWLFNFSQDLLCVIGFDGHFKRLNPAWEQVLGFSADELQKQSVVDLVHPEDRESLTTTFQAVLSGVDRASFKARFRSKDGRYNQLQWNVNPSPAQKAIYGAAYDLSEENRSAARMYRRLFESSKDGILIVDAKTGGIRDINPCLLEMSGYTFDEVVGEHIAHGALLRKHGLGKTIFDQLQNKDTVLREGVIEGKHGQSCTVELLCNVYTEGPKQVIQCNIRNISARKAVEQTLQDSEERFRLLVEGVRDYALFMLDPSGRIASWNIGAERLLGYTTAEVLGQHFNVLFTPEDQQVGVARAEIDRAARTGKSDDDRWHQRKDGTRFYVSGILTALHGPDGLLRGFAKLMHDVTERRQTEEALRLAGKLESIGLLAGGIAHDFNNLLVGIMGGISYAKPSLRQDDPAYDMLLLAQKSSEKAADLIRQLLAYAGKGHWVTRRLNLSEQISAAQDLLRLSVPRTIRLDLNLSSGLPSTEADPSQIQQIVMNLVINAAEAIGENVGHIQVLTGSQTLTADAIRANARLDGLKPGEYVYLEVVDTGVGMDSETMAKIFDPFFSTKFIGRGLGLAAVSGIVRSYKGAITVASTVGEGSTFRVLLPATQVADNTPGETERDCVENDLKGTGTVLIVDDEEVVLKTARATLERYGYNVIQAMDGQEAVNVVRARGREIDVILLDMTMPVMSGEEACPLIRQLQPNTPIVISSGYGDFIASKWVDRIENTSFLKKPYSSIQLAEKIKFILEANEERRHEESGQRGG